MASSATGAVRYGESSLADVLPSALAALGVAGEPNVLAIEPAECVVVLLVDGLGWQLLRAHSYAAPFLSSLAARPLTAGFPTTTGFVSPARPVSCRTRRFSSTRLRS